MRYLQIILFFIFFLNGVVKSDEYQLYAVGQPIENSISILNGRFNIPLPKGKFTVIATHKSSKLDSNLEFEARRSHIGGGMSGSYSIDIYDIGIAAFKGKVLDKYVSIKFSQPLDGWIFAKNCKRENLYFYKNYINGKAFNCWFVNHNTMQLTSDKIKSNSYYGKVKQYIINNGIILPNITVYSEHIYSSPIHKNVYFQVRYYENPEISGVPKAESKTWAQSEYQITKISAYPKKKAFMENYIIKSAKYQRDFENNIRMPPQHRLDTYVAVKKQTLENAKPKSNMVNELSDLNKLYKSGALSKEEFEKAKKQILSK